MTSIEKELKESVINGKCFHKIIQEHKQPSLCTEQTCEGYGVYLEGDMVVPCGKYKRVTKLSFSKEEKKA